MVAWIEKVARQNGYSWRVGYRGPDRRQRYKTFRRKADADLFAGIDLLLIDLQDVGARYYTYAASAVWAAETAVRAGCEVWLLDRPNPLGGEIVEGNLRQPGYESFVGALSLPVRHGLTLAELVLLEAERGGWRDGIATFRLASWRRSMLWPELGRPWVAPSPNLPRFETALVYPGHCLVEGTTLSEGRGTTRPFELVGGPGIDPPVLAERLSQAPLEGVGFTPVYFRPQAQKHVGELCGGVQTHVTSPARYASVRAGVELIAALHAVGGESFGWRTEPYEFVADRPAVDLLSGDRALRRALDGGEGLETWLSSWAADEESFRRERRAVLLYDEESG
ncbi:MAG: exo-beta-N-acetylmuramidase NamZ domain-containing protein [Thermoanaerobaculia bacterium]